MKLLSFLALLCQRTLTDFSLSLRNDTLRENSRYHPQNTNPVISNPQRGEKSRMKLLPFLALLSQRTLPDFSLSLRNDISGQAPPVKAKKHPPCHFESPNRGEKSRRLTFLDFSLPLRNDNRRGKLPVQTTIPPTLSFRIPKGVRSLGGSRSQISRSRFEMTIREPVA